MLMLGPATSWQPGGQGLLLVVRLVTNLPSPSQPEVPKQYTYTATAMAAMACPDAGPSTRAGAGLTRFICVNCSATGRLSSRGLFLHRATVRRHISASKACFAADLGYKEIHVEARPDDVMAGAGGAAGAAGPAPEVRHQPPGTTIYIYILQLCLVSEQRCWHSG
jgi:hypothetical protein